jgi:putative NADH-flavin reductase
MKLALYGATGTIGQRILAEALRRGHTVTAIARDPSKLTVHDANVTAVAGDMLDAENVAALVAGHDAVISAFGPSHEAPHTVIDAARSLIGGLSKAGVKRLIVVGGAGSLEVAPGVQIVDTPDFPEAWKPVALAARDALTVYRTEGDGIDWTYFSPAALIQPGERTGVFRLGGDNLVVDAEGNSRISAEDYAIALLDEIEHPQYIRQRFTAAY